MDVDFDVAERTNIKDLFPQTVPAAMVQNNQLQKHPVGHYFQNIAVDQVTNLAAIPYKEAEDVGYTKIDFLHLKLLDNIETKQQYLDLMHTEPDWSMLHNPEIVGQLFQLHNHYDTVILIEPKTVEELADCIALIRPGKKHLIEHYRKNQQQTRKELYEKTDEHYSYKKSHAIAYAFNIVIQMNLISRGIL